jgi:hypothetical protein
MLLNKTKGARKATPTQTVILRKLDSWIQPELCLALRMINVHVHP